MLAPIQKPGYNLFTTPPCDVPTRRHATATSASVFSLSPTRDHILGTSPTTKHKDSMVERRSSETCLTDTATKRRNSWKSKLIVLKKRTPPIVEPTPRDPSPKPMRSSLRRPTRDTEQRPRSATVDEEQLPERHVHFCNEPPVVFRPRARSEITRKPVQYKRSVPKSKNADTNTHGGTMLDHRSYSDNNIAIEEETGKGPIRRAFKKLRTKNLNFTYYPELSGIVI